MSLFLERNSYYKDFEIPFRQRLANFSWSYFLLIFLTACIGFVVLYSAAGGDASRWMMPQIYRFLLGCAALFVVALIDLRFWMKYAYILYLLSLGLLVAVEITGATNMGAQRWLEFAGFRLQPSELMKITLVLALARYFHASSDEDVEHLTHFIVPGILTIVTVALVYLQPDLGTSLMLAFVGVAIFFLMGISWKKVIVAGVLGIAAIPVGWYFMHDYQKERVLTFLNPERDPLGAGYHILQSKITLGSGGLFGKGFLQGTQSHLNFIPEKHTDFIFTILSEEFGLIGSSFLIILYMLIIAYGFYFALKGFNCFGKILALGLTVNFSLYLFINTAMVMGLLPVVGVPLPLVSYGGSALVVLMAGFGFIECVHINEEMEIGRLGSSID